MGQFYKFKQPDFGRYIPNPGPGPEYVLFEVANLDGWAYVHLVDGAELPDQPENIQATLEPVTADPGLVEKLKAASVPYKNINYIVRTEISKRYRIEDEIKQIREAKVNGTDPQNSYIKEHLDWARSQKALLGL